VKVNVIAARIIQILQQFILLLTN